MTIRTYSQLVQIPDHLERYRYLAIEGARVGDDTFGHERFLNQDFYRRRDWKQVRDYVIARDYGLDLACYGHEFRGLVIVHHMNPMTPEDILHGDPSILDPEFLITVSHKTHNAIHYGSEGLLPQPFVERRPGDTLLWGPRRGNG